MIRFFDAATLAYTKLRTHKVRTGITVGIAGILFGLLLAVVFVTQGVFDSIGRFSQEGLNNRAIVSVTNFTPAYPIYDHLEDPEFIALVEAQHQAVIDKKVAAAKKYKVSYDPAIEDPSPVEQDAKTKAKRINDSAVQSEAVQEVAKELLEKDAKPFNIQDYIAQYPSARILPDNAAVMNELGEQISYMENGRDSDVLTPLQKNQAQAEKRSNSEPPSLLIMNQSVTDPFINKSASYDASKGEVPVIMPFKTAEKLLGLKAVAKDATTQVKYDRLQEVRSRASEITAEFCYRNAASQQMVSQAVTQREAMEEGLKIEGYQAPALQYSVPTADSCGAVGIAKDTRPDTQKKSDEARILFEKEIGTYIGEPVQYKIVVRPVGISAGYPEVGSAFDVSGLVQSLLGSWLVYGEQWIVPANMLRQIPEDKAPDILTQSLEKNQGKTTIGLSSTEQYMVEFGNFDEARALLKSGEMQGYQMNANSTFVTPFGSSTLTVVQLKEMFLQAMLWALLVVGGVAIIIMSSIVGRTVSEGRRESAIFRAIGARRSDIGSIYGMYAFLLSIRVAIFALVLGAVLALAAELFLWEQATLAARYAYAASDASASFHFFSITNWYVALILAAIIVFGLVASIVPVIRSARRNPIQDMRDDT